MSPPLLPSLYTPTPLISVAYGPQALHSLPSFLASPHLPANAKVLLLTGSSLSKSHLIEVVREFIGPRLGAEFHGIAQHAPIEGIREAVEVAEREACGVIVGFGGGSVVDAAKMISYMHHQKHGVYLPQIAIPTTLSVAECTYLTGYTDEEGNKVGVVAEELAPKFIIYDPEMTLATPERLWLSTGMRALDHAVEGIYRPKASAMAQHLAIKSIGDLFTYLPESKAAPDDVDVRAKLQVAAWESLGNASLSAGLGISHSLGHKLGAKYSIPHGITSCLTLAPSVALMSSLNLITPHAQHHIHLAILSLPPSFIDASTSLTDASAAGILSGAIEKLVRDLGLETSLGAYGVTEDMLAGAPEAAVKELAGWDAAAKPSVESVAGLLHGLLCT